VAVVALELAQPESRAVQEHVEDSDVGLAAAAEFGEVGCHGAGDVNEPATLEHRDRDRDERLAGAEEARLGLARERDGGFAFSGPKAARDTDRFFDGEHAVPRHDELATRKHTVRVLLPKALDQSRRLRRVHASTRWVRSIRHAGADLCRAAPLVPSSFSRRRGPIEQGGGERPAPCNATFAKDQRGLRRDGARRGAPPEGNLGVRAPEQEVGGDVAF
jgi:hypothetical protein